MYSELTTVGVVNSVKKCAQLSKHRLLVLEYVGPRVAAKLVATPVGLALASAVPLPCVTRRVVAVAVELDGQLALRPTAVDEATARRPVGLRQRQTMLPQRCDEAPLELAEKKRRVPVQHAAKSRRTLRLRVAPEDDRYTVGCEAVLHGRLVEGAGELRLCE